MTVSTLHSSEKPYMNGGYPSSTSSSSVIQDDPRQKYARILYEHTRRQMDIAAHSIHTGPTSSPSPSSSSSSAQAAGGRISSREGHRHNHATPA